MIVERLQRFFCIEICTFSKPKSEFLSIVILYMSLFNYHGLKNIKLKVIKLKDGSSYFTKENKNKNEEKDL